MEIKKLEDITYVEIIELLNNHGLIIYPSDTCYGIACDPTDPVAVEKLLKYKMRREGKAISIAVTDLEMAARYADINDTARSIYTRFLPGPYTVISKSKGVVAQGIEAENGTVGIRIPDSKWLLDLVEKYGKAITATSANQSYQKTPYKIQDILENLSKKSEALLDLIIDGGELEHNPPSTVMDTTMGDIQVLRKGKFLPENSKIHEFVSNSEAETIEFGAKLFKQYQKNLEFRPLLFALQGDLGAGKTQFTKGLAQSMGITEQVISPTFILSREYDSPIGNRLYHIDTWRLETDEDFESIGFRKMLDRSSEYSVESIQSGDINHLIELAHQPPTNYHTLSIEWADKVQQYLTKLDVNVKIIWIEIEADTVIENKRTIRWSE